MNDSGKPRLQGATNMKLKNADGVCVLPREQTLTHGEDWSSLGVAAQVIAQAGRRSGVNIPPPVIPMLTPPVNDTADSDYAADLCVRFGALPCVEGKMSQRWALSTGSKPGDGSATTIRSAVSNGTNHSGWSTDNCGWGGSIGVTVQSQPIPSTCLPLPPPSYVPNATDGSCVGTYPQAFLLRANGTI
eukprot:SAG31_NODE_18070_length_648_cov_0.542805_1_plen_187_part_10